MPRAPNGNDDCRGGESSADAKNGVDQAEAFRKWHDSWSPYGSVNVARVKREAELRYQKYCAEKLQREVKEQQQQQQQQKTTAETTKGEDKGEGAANVNNKRRDVISEMEYVVVDNDEVKCAESLEEDEFVVL